MGGNSGVGNGGYGMGGGQVRSGSRTGALGTKYI